MKKPEEIKRGLEIAKTNCLYVECCEDICPYNKNCDVNDQDVMTEIPREMVSDSLVYIQQLEQDNAQKDERIRELEREKEAAIKDMHAAQGCVCLVCKNFIPEESGDKKYACKGFGGCEHEEDLILCGLFEWRGVEEEKHAED